MISVNYNPSILKTQNNLNIATSNLNKSLMRMSTGFKINSASDDAAGLYIATKLNSQIRGLKQAQSNVSNGLSYLSIAEGALNNMTSILSRVRDLAVQGANGVYDENARTAMQSEADALVAELGRIKSGALFNGINVFGEGSTQNVSQTPVVSADSIPAGYTAIYTAEDLSNIRNNLSGKYILMNDIDLSGIDWEPIGDAYSFDTTFRGCLDGNGHVIKNLTVNSSDSGGLFAMIANWDGDTVKNLGFENANITSTSCAGVIAGIAFGDSISNCWATGNVTSINSFAGGLFGTNDDGYLSIDNCYFEGNVTSKNNSAGGLVGGSGFAVGPTNCYVNANVTAKTYAGGFIAVATDFGIKNSYFTGNLKADKVGGFVGTGDSSMTWARNSYWNKSTSGAKDMMELDYGSSQSYNVPDAKGLTSAEMRNADNYTDWDTNIWDFSNGLPTLKNMPKASKAYYNVRMQVGENSDSITNALNLNLGFDLTYLRLDYTDSYSCADAIKKIDNMLSNINKKISDIGAHQNRLESVMESQSTRILNYTAAKSTIMDADIAEESASFVKEQILQRTTSSLLSQAQNLQSDVVLNMINSMR